MLGSAATQADEETRRMRLQPVWGLIAVLALAGQAAAQSVTVRPMDWSDHMGGCFGYLLFRPGARSLLGRAARDGIHHGIDWFIMRQAAPDLCVMRVEPHLVSTSVAVPGSQGDSNVQHDFEPLR